MKKTPEKEAQKADVGKKIKKKNNALKGLLSSSLSAADKFGRYIASVLKTVLLWAGVMFAAVGRKIWNSTQTFRRNMSRRFAYLFIIIKSPFKKFFSVVSKALKDIAVQRKEKGLFRAILAALGHIAGFIFGKRGLAVTIFNYGIPIVSIIFLFNLVAYATDINYAVKLTVNGQFIGYIENEQVFYDAETELKKKMNYLGSNTDIEFIPEYSIEKIGNIGTLTKYQVSDNILKNSGIEVDFGYGLYINDIFYGAVSDNTEIKKVLNGMLEKYQEQYPSAEVSFVDDIRYLDTMGLYLADSFKRSSDLVRILTSKTASESYYTIEDGDSHLLICDKLDMSMAEMEILNPGFEQMELYGGEKLVKRMEIPFISVAVTLKENYNVDVDYTSNYHNDSSLYIGTSRVTKEGTKGVNNVTANVKYVNGMELSRVVINSRVVTAPIPEEIAIGTKPPPEGEYSSETAGYGKFIWPVNGGYVSELTEWDGGYSGHRGVDIAAPYGTSIYAGASGTVTFTSNWYYGYGMCVIIQHDNGLSTLYAHCSSIFVQTGQQVTQGECIAAVGATGKATGNHLHFEVRNGYEKYNPVDYIENLYYR